MLVKYNSEIPFINYALEDKSGYTHASEVGYIDRDDDFLVGQSGGLLPNIDFIFKNTHLLREAGNNFDKTGLYTLFEIDSPEHLSFRLQEELRRKEGFTAHCKLYYKDIEYYDRLVAAGKQKEADKLLRPLHITGDHYNFINYGKLNKLIVSTAKVSRLADGTLNVSGQKKTGVPEFMDAQYWWYKIQQLARDNGKHVLGGKSRRKGCSYMAANDTANAANLIKECTVLNVAYDYKYLTQGNMITGMTLEALDNYDLNTPFKRGLISRDLEYLYLGFKEKNNVDSGYKSKILSLSTLNNPEVAIGKDAIIINIEELSNLPNFDDFMAVTEPTTRTGSITTGIIKAWGTGGATEGKWIIFEKNFYNPKRHKFLEFENIWDKDKRNKTCAYFIPYIQSLQGFDGEGNYAMDNDGNSLYHIAERIHNEERLAAKTTKNYDDFLLYCGQYPNMPSEAFSSTGSNMFCSPGLSSYIDTLRQDQDAIYYTDGDFTTIDNATKFRSNAYLSANKIKTHPYIEYNPTSSKLEDYEGCIRVFHYPYTLPNGLVPEGMYEISYDPVGKSKELEKLSIDNSLCSITVWMKANVYLPKLAHIRCANFIGRRNELEEMDAIAYNMSVMYNCKVGFENTRGETRTNFKAKGALNKLLHEPSYLWNSKIKINTPTEYGINLSNREIKIQGLRALKELIYEEVGKDNETNQPILFYQTCTDIEFLRELTQWDFEGNFDRVSDAIIRSFYHKHDKYKATMEATSNTAFNQESVLDRPWY